MRWPFKSNTDQNIRIFRDPRSDVITLRVRGPVGLPADNPLLTLTVTIDYQLDDDAVALLQNQLAHFTRKDEAG